MGNRKNTMSGRLDSPSPERETNNIEVETPNQGNETLPNNNVDCQERLGEKIWFPK